LGFQKDLNIFLNWEIEKVILSVVVQNLAAPSICTGAYRAVRTIFAIRNLFHQHRYRNSIGSLIAQLTDPKLQLEAIKAFSIANCTVLLGRDRNYQSLSLILGARIARYNLHVRK
jgi:uncharacterized membrane protein